MNDQSEKEILNRLLPIFRDVFSINEITLESSMNSLKRWDSVGHVSLIHKIEKSFRVKFSYIEIRTLTNVAAIVRVLAEKETS